MYYDIELRVLKEADYIIKEGATVRKTAAVFAVSKSTVHHDVTVKLKSIDVDRYVCVKQTLSVNLSERHIRGGMATRRKYIEKDEK